MRHFVKLASSHLWLTTKGRGLSITSFITSPSSPPSSTSEQCHPESSKPQLTTEMKWISPAGRSEKMVWTIDGSEISPQQATQNPTLSTLCSMRLQQTTFVRCIHHQKGFPTNDDLFEIYIVLKIRLPGAMFCLILVVGPVRRRQQWLK